MLAAALDDPGRHKNLASLSAHTESLENLAGSKRAGYVWALIRELIFAIRDEKPNPGVALRAVFLGLGDEKDVETSSGDEGIAARLRAANGRHAFQKDVSDDTLFRYWTEGVIRLALSLEERLARLSQDPRSWQLYAPEVDGPIAKPEEAGGDRVVKPPPPGGQRIFVQRLVATYGLKGRAVNYAISERTIVAKDDDVDRYVVRARSPNPDAANAPRIAARLNCRVGKPYEIKDVNGGVTHEVAMIFENLKSGQSHFFASAVTSQSDDEDPLVEVQVTTQGIAPGGLTMRVQFDNRDDGGVFPEAAWWFAECLDVHRLVEPPEGDGRRLNWTKYGYLEHTFEQLGLTGHRYGIGWRWPDVGRGRQERP